MKTLEPRGEHRKAVCRAPSKALAFISLTGKETKSDSIRDSIKKISRNKLTLKTEGMTLWKLLRSRTGVLDQDDGTQTLFLCVTSQL